MPGILYVVATPIGNLEDVTLRALRILGEVAVIAAEDTRRSTRLLQHYSISTRTTSLHEHNERAKTPALVAQLLAGDSIALVSDAGTPGLSDPGAHLVAAAHAAGIRVEPIPGASAAIAVVSAAGFPVNEFRFMGFPPRRSNARKTWLLKASRDPGLLVVYEAPHRIAATLQDMLETLGDRIAALGREVTKAHEELVVRPISEHLRKLGDPRGEYVLVVRGYQDTESTHTVAPQADEVAALFGDLTDNIGLSRRSAIHTLADRYGVPARAIFSLLEEAKHSVE
jgi:16S rRNA (cytidine1402-2'-O)-methyltransferase